MSLHRSVMWAAAGMLVAWLWLEAAANLPNMEYFYLFGGK